MRLEYRRMQMTLYLVGGGFVVAFVCLALAILSIQQRIVGVTHETRDVMVPQFLEQIRAVRNLEVLRHHGSLAAQAADPIVRQDAAYLAAFTAGHPSSRGDPPTQQLVGEANRHIQALAKGDGTLPWRPMEERLAAQADALSVATGNLVLQRATEIRDDSLLVRNVAMGLSLLFALGMLVMLVLGRYLLAELRTKNQFFNEASHDFRQRLHGMQLLINTAQRTTQEDAPAVVARVKAATADLQRYLDNFLEIARLEASTEARPLVGPINLQDVFQQLELQFEDAARHQGVNLTFRYTQAVLRTNEKTLLRILENLVSNAVKFARGRVLVVARPRGGRLEIWVCDNGDGIPVLPSLSLFDAFVQGRNVGRIGGDRGFGLGLSIVMRAAGLLGAKVVVCAKSGQGSTVKLIFDKPGG